MAGWRWTGVAVLAVAAMWSDFCCSSVCVYCAEPSVGSAGAAGSFGCD